MDRLTAAFDDFLYSPIAESRNGSPVSVVSGLAQLNLDPWLEAAELARLARDAAITRLAGLIAELSDRLATQDTPRAIAARLVDLLPQAGGGDTTTKTAPARRPRIDPRIASYATLTALAIAVIFYVLSMSTHRSLPAVAPPIPSARSDAVPMAH